jgi:hypothetical protein
LCKDNEFCLGRRFGEVKVNNFVARETRVLILGKNHGISCLMGRILIRAAIYEPIRSIWYGGVYDVGEGIESEV